MTWPKWKLSADKIKHVTQNLKFPTCREVIIVRKRENIGHQHFHLFPKYFQKPSSWGLLKLGIVWKMVKNSVHNFVVLGEGVNEDQIIPIMLSDPDLPC